MQLAAIYTQEENEHIQWTLQNTPELTYNGDDLWWIGGTDQGSEGKFYWLSNGHQIGFTDFATGQPDNANGTENCLELMGPVGHKWNDRNCDIERFFICKQNQCATSCSQSQPCTSSNCNDSPVQCESNGCIKYEKKYIFN